MARLNTGARSLSITGTFNLSYAFTGGLITLSGTAPYTVTLVNPVFFPGAKQEFYNATAGNITLSTPSGSVIGPGFTSATSQVMPAGSTFTLISNGSNYVITNDEGGPLQGTAVVFTTSATVPTVQGSTANGGTLTINSTSSATKPTAGILMTDNISSTTTATGTLVVTGGVGVSENIRSGGTIYGNLNSSNVALSGTGSINSITVGSTTRAAGAFTTLAANSTATFTGAITADTGTNNQSHTTTGAGVITINSGTTGSIVNMTIGLTGTAQNGTFATMTATTATITNGTISTAPSNGNDIANKTYVDSASRKVTGIGYFYGSGM
jgi:hypothetical protein